MKKSIVLLLSVFMLSLTMTACEPDRPVQTFDEYIQLDLDDTTKISVSDNIEFESYTVYDNREEAFSPYKFKYNETDETKVIEITSLYPVDTIKWEYFGIISSDHLTWENPIADKYTATFDKSIDLSGTQRLSVKRFTVVR